jgi:hypothetical protein
VFVEQVAKPADHASEVSIVAIETRSIVGWLTWGAFAFGIVNLGHLPGEFEDSLCGPWG